MRLSRQDQHGNLAETSGKLFISREACIDLGIFSDNFPTIDETQVQPQTTLTCRPDSISAYTCDSSLTADCSCPQRQLPPSLHHKYLSLQLKRITHNSVSTFWIITDPAHPIHVTPDPNLNVWTTHENHGGSSG